MAGAEQGGRGHCSHKRGGGSPEQSQEEALSEGHREHVEWEEALQAAAYTLPKPHARLAHLTMGTLGELLDLSASVASSLKQG